MSRSPSLSCGPSLKPESPRVSKRFAGLVLGALLFYGGGAGCRDTGSELARDGSALSDLGPAALDEAQSGPGDLRTADLRSPPDLTMWPAAMPPPASCNQRQADRTAIQAVVLVDQYKGLQTGRNGTHEIVDATLIHTTWVFDASKVDTTNVQLAMNVQDAMDMSGLPREIPVSKGQTFEVEGEYIPSTTASATTAKGKAAVIHFTHSPCGFVVIAGTRYE